APPPSSVRGDDDLLHGRIAYALGTDAGNLGDGQMHDPSLVRIERRQLLGGAVLQHLLRQELGRLPKLGVLVPAKPLAVDQDTAVLAQLSPKRDVDDGLKRSQGLAALKQEGLAALAFDVHADAFTGLSAGDRDVQSHGASHRGHKLDDLILHRCRSHSQFLPSAVRNLESYTQCPLPRAPSLWPAPA